MRLRDRTSRPIGEEIPTASMPDIAFLLVIFFMVTATFSATRGIVFDVPALPDDEVVVDSNHPIVVDVRAEAVTIDCGEVQENALIPTLREALAQAPERELVLYVDRSVPYARMVRYYDAILAAGRSGALPLTELSMPLRADIEGYVSAFGVNPFDVACR